MRMGESFFQSLCTSDHELNARSTIAYEVGDHAKFIQQSAWQELSVIDQQQHAVRALYRRAQKVNKRQPQFTLGKLAVGLPQFEQDVLQEIVPATHSAARKHIRDPKDRPIFMFQYGQQLGFSQSAGTNNDHGAR